MTLDELNQRFAINGFLSFIAGPGDLPTVRIDTAEARALITLFGAQVLEFTPRGEQPLLFLSENAVFDGHQAIRGGIPLCWPWFNQHPSDPTRPRHGFCRSALWTVASTSLEDETPCIDFVLHDDAQTRSLWPHAFALRYRVRVGRYLDVTLTHHNTDCDTVTVGGALHSYLAVGDIDDCRLRGLEQAAFDDALSADHHQTQAGHLIIDQEIDRIYASDALVYLDDASRCRCTVVAKGGSQSTVIWNPWATRSEGLADLPDDAYREMLCIECANAGADQITLAPDASHHLRCLIGREDFGWELSDL